MTAKRILFVLPSLTGGGAQHVFTLLLRHFDRSRFEPHLALLQRGDPGRAEPELPADIVVHRLERSHVRSALPGLVRLARRIEPAAAFSALGYINLTVLMAKPFFPHGTRVLVREANTPSFSIASTHSPRLFRALYAFFYPMADGIACQSEGIRDDLLRLLGSAPRCPMAIVANPVDVEEISRLSRSGADPFQGASRPRLVAAGRLTRQKGFDLLLKAFAHPAFSGDFPEAELFILGEGSERPELEKKIRDIGLGKRVTLTGFRENPYPYYAAADVFALPSRWEGMPNAVLEALACGTPVVSWRDAGAVADVVTDGENGILVGGSDPGDFAAGLARALKLFAARQRADLLPGRFQIEDAVRRYEEFVSKALSS